MGCSSSGKSLIVSLNLETLMIEEIISRPGAIALDIIPGKTNLNDLFVLKKRDMAYISSTSDYINLISATSRSNRDSTYLLAVEKSAPGKSAECTILPKSCNCYSNNKAEGLLKEISAGKYEVFNPLLPSPLFIINHEEVILAANKPMFDLFGVNETSICGTSFNNVFRCSASHEGEKFCGTMYRCRNCKLRTGIGEILDKTLTVLKIDTDFEFFTNNGYDVMNVSVTAAEITYKGMVFIAVSFKQI